MNDRTKVSQSADLAAVTQSFAHREWMTRAACAKADPELFFPETDRRRREDRDGREGREAIEICRACPVSEACLATALANNEVFGIWGGRTQRQRTEPFRGDTARPARRFGTRD